MRVVRLNRGRLVPASHEDPAAPGVLKQVLFSKNELMGGRVQMINWAVLPAGKSFRPHYHEDMEEVFVLVRGSARIRVGSEEFALSEGDAVAVPKETLHEMKNTGEDDVEYVVVGITEERCGRTVVA